MFSSIEAQRNGPGQSPLPDLDRLRAEYAQRQRRLAHSDLYSPFNQAQLFTLQQRQRAVLSLLRRLNLTRLRDLNILELGCGAGGVLTEWLGYGVNFARLHGTELLPYRLLEAQGRLPYASGAIDLALQFTVFSSILDESVKQQLAGELLRVLRRPGGVILWYDFWLNPTNRQTRGIGPAEIQQLFPGCRFACQRVTLAPPLARRLVPVSWTLSSLLEKVGLLNSHYLAAIRPGE